MDEHLPNTLQIIGMEWKQRSRELAEWAMVRLVNRKDVWGQYTGPSQRRRGQRALTLPQKSMRGQDMVTIEKLARHFGSLRRDHLIGLHAASPDEQCLWLAVDIDLHDADAEDAADAERRNFAAAAGWWEVLQARGYDPLLFDSNGAGGYHLWVLLEQPAPMAHVHAFAQELISDWQARNLDAKPETFPKSARLGGDKMGAWLRLPGVHHSRDHITRVWSGDAWMDEPWEEGNAAIDAILRTTPGPPPPVPEEGASTTVRRRKSKTARRREKPAVCVDLDGVLAHYDGWQGVFHFGAPVEGAADFVQRLSERAEIIIFTARLQDSGDGDTDLDAVEAAVRAWLDQNQFVYHSIYRGTGKPLARAYIDDRAVSCRPQTVGPLAAFTDAEAQVRDLLKAK
ncbi:MAG: hypothetical protein R3F19_26205 [Verrucomicrobiales bacterium]